MSKRITLIVRKFLRARNPKALGDFSDRPASVLQDCAGG